MRPGIGGKDGFRIQLRPADQSVFFREPIDETESVVVDQVNDKGRYESGQVLCGQIVGHLPPGVLAEDGQSERSGRVNMRVGDVTTAQRCDHSANAIGEAHAEQVGRLEFEKVSGYHRVTDSL